MPAARTHLAYLGRHVVECANPADWALFGGIDGKSKITQAQRAISLKEYVFRLEVSVDDAQLVQGVKHFQQGSHNLQECTYHIAWEADSIGSS